MALFKKKSLLDQAQDYVGAIRPQVESAVEQAREAVEDFVESARPVIADAYDKAGPALADARDKAVPLINDARAKAVPVLVDARDKAVPLINDGLATAREKAAPYVADAASRAGETASAARGLAEAKVAQLKGEPEPKKGGTLKKIALFAAVAGVVGVVAKKLQGGGSAAESWQSSYTPAPPPKPATGPGSAVPPVTPSYSSPPVEDAGGASPDEALADQTAEVPGVSTPDDPAEVIALPIDPEDDTKA